ncbi:zinc finger protein 82 homolog [Ascaphus truei]|uniref:zinc finger protein 82 homolog n=1 Tax=Ascaphus truei TaxID=8439 RepID=UPI003F5ACF71
MPEAALMILFLLTNRQQQLENSLFQEPVEFDKVAIIFSKDEWDYLTEEQKELYKDVMMENYQALCSLGCVNVTPEIVSMIERGEEPYIKGHQQYKEKESPTDISTVTNLPMEAQNSTFLWTCDGMDTQTTDPA